MRVDVQKVLGAGEQTRVPYGPEAHSFSSNHSGRWERSDYIERLVGKASTNDYSLAVHSSFEKKSVIRQVTVNSNSQDEPNVVIKRE